MNKKNLMDAFGDINEEMFGGAEKIDITDYEESESQLPVIVYKGEKKMNKGPIFAAGAAVCAAAIAVSVPLIIRSGGEYPLNTTLSSDTESFESITEISETASELITTPEETAPLLTLPYDQDFEYELYVKDKEFLDAEELYNVDIKDINIERFNENGNIDVLFLSLFYGNDLIYLEGDELYYSQTVNDPAFDAQINSEHEDWAAVYKYNLVTEEHAVVFKEKSNDNNYGLMLKIEMIDGDWLYYYHLQHRSGYEEQTAELWRYNINDGRKEKIIDVGETCYSSVSSAIKSDKFLYFPFSRQEIRGYDVNGDSIWHYVSYIYSYDTENGRLELVKSGDCYYRGLYKDGIIYNEGYDYYYHKNGEEKDEFLFNEEQLFDFNLYYNSWCVIYSKNDMLMYYYERDDNNISVFTFGYLDENFNAHELMTTKGYLWTQSETGNEFILQIDIDSVTDAWTFYDQEKDCFSSLPLPKTTQRDTRVWCHSLDSTDEEIRFIVFECDHQQRSNYWWAKLYTISKK